MIPIKKYKSFLYSYYVSGGIRITAGVVLPAIVLGYYDMLSAGVAVSLGALLVSFTDTPGPIHHRRNGMMVCLGIVTVVALMTAVAAPYPIISGIFIFIFCFIFSFIGIYGVRANSIGLSALLVIVLQIGSRYEGWQIFIQAAYIMAGGAWYTALSLVLYGFRPYKLAQQAMGEYITSLADYLRIRASFYEPDVEYEKAYREMAEQQVIIHHQQELVQEMLFKSRDIVKESTATGQTLLMLFGQLTDLFEKIMTSYQDFKEIHAGSEYGDLMKKYKELILSLSNELDNISLAVKSGFPSHESSHLSTLIQETKDYHEQLRNEKRNAATFEYFIALRHILENIEDIEERVRTLHLYTTYNEKAPPPDKQPEHNTFITRQDFSPKLLKDNFTLSSNYFRHSLRVSIATLAGYIISKFLVVGHSYWIILTIIVILKPTYSLTKKRNYERLIGTIVGAIMGTVILYTVKDRTALFAIMLFLMVGAYSFLRAQYLIGVLLMTPYILLMIHIIYGGSPKTILYDRLLDTAIGSVIAFFANLFLVPVWEHEQIKSYMAASIESNKEYFRDISQAFIGKAIGPEQYKHSRRNAFVALANLSDAFTRMLSEPKRKQKNIRLINEFVVANHLLSSHIATLSTYAEEWAGKYRSQEFEPVIKSSIGKLEAAKLLLEDKAVSPEPSSGNPLHQLSEQVNALVIKRREELKHGQADTDTRKLLLEFKSSVDQFIFIHKLASDCRKISLALSSSPTS